MTTASPEVIILVSAGLMAVAYAFVCGIRQDRRGREVLDWVREHHRDRWLELPWVYRMPFFGQIAVGVLLRSALSAEPEFAVRYARVKRLRRRQLVALAVGAACIALVLIGTRSCGWKW